MRPDNGSTCPFQHTAARRRLDLFKPCLQRAAGFNTQPPEGGWVACCRFLQFLRCFNTQPPEGGWLLYLQRQNPLFGFNTQPPEGGWNQACGVKLSAVVSTHSRPKAAGSLKVRPFSVPLRFQHTAARRRLANSANALAELPLVSTHSRPKAAGCWRAGVYSLHSSFNTQPPEGGWAIR